MVLGSFSSRKAVSDRFISSAIDRMVALLIYKTEATLRFEKSDKLLSQMTDDQNYSRTLNYMMNNSEHTEFLVLLVFHGNRQ